MSTAMLRIAHRIGIVGALTTLPISGIHNIIQRYKNFEKTLRDRIAEIAEFDNNERRTSGRPVYDLHSGRRVGRTGGSAKHFLAEERERISRLRDFLALGLYLIRALRTSFKGKDGTTIKSEQKVM